MLTCIDPGWVRSRFMPTDVMSCRLKVEQEAIALEAELLEQATAREQELLAVISTLQIEAIEWKETLTQLIVSFKPDLTVCSR